MRSSNFLRFFLLFVSVLVASVSCAQQPSGSTQRNVLLLIADDTGFDFGYCGNKVVRTPNIDRLASEGMQFTQGYAAVSSCSPSRATLFTGMYNHRNGQYGLAHGEHNQRTRPDAKTLPKLLNDKGYHTGIIGKIHVETAETYPFDVRVPGPNRKPMFLRNSTSDFVRGAGDKPFFLVVGFGDTHRAGKAFGLPRAAQPTTGTAAETGMPKFLNDVPQVRADFADYLESVNNLDKCVGAVLGALADNGKTTSTLVIFVSDNGIPFPGAKTNFYDPGIHLPMLVSMPGAKLTTPKTDAMVSWVDVAPTILDYTGTPGREAMHGRSVLPLLNGASSADWDHIFASHTFHEITMYYPMRCVRTRDYKLIWNLAHQLPYPLAGDLKSSPTWKAIEQSADKRVGKRTMDQYLNRPEFELYDLRKDPDELHNLAGKPELKEIQDKLHAQILDMMRKTQDPWGKGETTAE